MGLRFLDKDPEPNPSKADARILREIERAGPSNLDSEVLGFHIIKVTCQASEGMLKAGYAAVLGQYEELEKLALDAYQCKYFGELRRAGL